MSANPSIALALIALAPVCSAVAATPPPPQDDTAAAFQAAFGSPHSAIRHVIRPRLSGRVNLAGAPVTLSVRPAALTPLGRDRYALLAFEDDATAAHVEPGAVAVAYLAHEDGRWRVLGAWPELAWTGNDGDAADSVVIERLGGSPLALLPSSDLGQGQATVSDWVIDLAPRAPAVLGRIPIAGSLSSGCDRCDHYDYEGHVGPGVAGALLSVRYTGWTTPANGKTPATPFTRDATFVLRSGKLSPTAPLGLPD